MTPPSPDLTIRPAVEADQALIRRMVRDADLDPTALHWSHFLLAEQGGEVVGIGQLRPGPELGSLVVLPEHRKQGIGGALIEALVARHAGDMFLECEGRMVPYYRRFGFEETTWREAPMPLKLKSGLGHFMGRVFGFHIAVMVRRYNGKGDGGDS